MAAPADLAATALAGYPKTVVLTDGAHLLVRPATAADAAARAELRRRSGASEPGGPDAAAPAAVVVLALDGERIAGEIGLHRRDAAPAAAEVVVVLDPAYRGRRLGTWLLLDCVHLAGSLGLERLTATAGTDQAYVEALRRLDFVDRAPDGGAGPRVLVKTLHRAWSDF
jgi:GNAT superfamily N-acetyltransferase